MNKLKVQEFIAFYENGLNLSDNCDSETKPTPWNFIINQCISLAMKYKTAKGFTRNTRYSTVTSSAGLFVCVWTGVSGNTCHLNIESEKS